MENHTILTNYVYLLKVREFVRTNEDIYKIGRTKKQNFTRFNQYPKGSILLFQMACDDCEECEKEIIEAFKTNFRHRKDVGTEYFEGNYKRMIDTIYSIVRDIEHFYGKNRYIDTEGDGIIEGNTNICYDVGSWTACKLCQKTFTRERNYDQHILSNSHKHRVNNKNEMFTCSCGKMFKQRNGLYRHKTSCDNVKTDKKIKELQERIGKNELRGCINLILDRVV